MGDSDAHSSNTMAADVASGSDDGSNWFLMARNTKRSTQAATIPSPAPVPRKTNAHLPPLPFDHYKVVFRPRDGLNLGAWPQRSVAQAIGVAAGLDAAVLNELIIRIRTDQNLAVISTPDEKLAAELQKVQSISLGLNQHAGQAYVAAPDNSCKGVVPGIEPNTTVKTLLENLRCSEAPILHARMMGSTNQALVTFFRHPAEVCPTPDKPRCIACGTSNPLPEHECTPRCIHCRGDHPATSPRCPSRQQRPFNKSYVLQERLKREKLSPPPGSAHSEPRTTAGSLRNPDQPTKTPANSAEQPPTSGRSSTHGPPGHDRQVDRGRPGNPSKERAAGSGHPKDHGQQEGAHNKEQTVSWAKQFPPHLSFPTLPRKHQRDNPLRNPCQSTHSIAFTTLHLRSAQTTAHETR
ncbi:hypothetical protein HPB49_006014 [Dermacentor silvarum]|uniref:Uncharacterized protein n=1 Tax=Dermacentor silvarum TaxID=543639 RepID=A0ACB8DB46_DERSI|nr:hypothetical protein HPB49_006014 [Dermacentor silvarum]